MSILTYTQACNFYEELRDERSEWEAEYRTISDYLLPGRGVYQTYSKPRKRKLVSPRVINTVAEDALYVLTSGMHGGLTSPSRPWFTNDWADDDLQEFEPLKAWLQDSTSRLHSGLQASNFYSVINSFYTEYAGFGTASVYAGEDTNSESIPFRFELLTAGEYVFSIGADGKVDKFFRTIFRTPKQIYDLFPETCSKELKKKVEKNEPGIVVPSITILEGIYKERFQDKSYTQIFYETTSSGGPSSQTPPSKSPLKVSGFYEFPYPLARWGTIGGDVYGIGPGSRALPDIRRLQEMEKAFLMATHKSIDPPLNAPARMRGKLNTLPGGYNYYANPAETINEIYRVNFDYQGVGAAIERVEQRIQRNFYNDLFLTASRDPNASPLKATQVMAQDQEKMLRLGPVIERLQHEFFTPLIERCFNIMLRKGLFKPLDPQLAEMAGNYKIRMVSPLASAQKGVALNGINSFMAFLERASQFSPEILDNIDSDATAREYADITGVELKILRPEKAITVIRKQRSDRLAKENEEKNQRELMLLKGKLDSDRANSTKTLSESDKVQAETSRVRDEVG